MEFTVRQIAQLVQGKVEGDLELKISGINSLEEAKEGELSFFLDPKYKELVSSTHASAILTSVRVTGFGGAQIIVQDPRKAYLQVVNLFQPSLPRFPSVSQLAFVHEEAQLGKDVSIFPFAYVERGAVIGARSTLFPGVFVGEGVTLGEDCVLYPNVTILAGCNIGNRVIIHAGSIVGADGFGYIRDGSKSIKIPQIGSVRIEDDVEVGANCCIDRAALGTTWIRRGVKIDNLVQVAHNVVIGEDSILVAQVGISGSVKIGREVVLAGQVGVADHISIGDRAMVGPQAGIAKPVGPGQVVSGTPAMPHRLWLKSSHLIQKLPDWNKKLRELEKRLSRLEEIHE